LHPKARRQFPEIGREVDPRVCLSECLRFIKFHPLFPIGKLDFIAIFVQFLV
jgi:hypothetical protein